MTDLCWAIPPVYPSSTPQLSITFLLKINIGHLILENSNEQSSRLTLSRNPFVSSTRATQRVKFNRTKTFETCSSSRTRSASSGSRCTFSLDRVARSACRWIALCLQLVAGSRCAFSFSLDRVARSACR